MGTIASDHGFSSLAESLADSLLGLRLLARLGVQVDIAGGLDGAVPQPVLDCAERNALAKENRRVGVSRVVESHTL